MNPYAIGRPNQPCPCGSGKKHKLCCAKWRPRTVVLIPVRDEITWPTQLALDRFSDWPVEVLTEIGQPVDVARNTLAERARALSPRPDLVIWCDSDAFWPAGTFTRLYRAVARLEAHDLVGVVHGPRNPGARITASRSIERLRQDAYLQTNVDFPADQLVPCAFIGAHMYAHRIELLDALGADPWTLTDLDDAEDFAWCRRVTAIGGHIWLDAGTTVFHFDFETGLAYLPAAPPFIIDGAGAFRTVAAPPVSVSRFRRYGPAVDEVRRRRMAVDGFDVDAMIALQEAGGDLLPIFVERARERVT